MSFFKSESFAILHAVRPFEIHGARFVDLIYSLESDPPESYRQTRVSDNLIYADPKPGDRVKIGLLMGNVTGIARVPDGTSADE